MFKIDPNPPLIPPPTNEYTQYGRDTKIIPISYTEKSLKNNNNNKNW